MKLKKILAIVLAAVMLTACAMIPAFAENDNPTRGDVNLDGKYNLLDCMNMLMMIANWNMEGATLSYENADMDQDGDLDISDVSVYLRWIASIPGYGPC